MVNMYHSLPIEDIKIGDRFRAGVGDLRDLKESILTHGLFHAIVIDREFNLLAGCRRLTACRELGHVSIYCRYIDEVDPLTAREIELEENLARENLSWQDEDRLRVEIDKLKRLKYGSSPSGPGSDLSKGWDQTDTARSLGVDKTTISRSVARVEAMAYVPSMELAPTRKAADRELDRFIQEIETELNLRIRGREALALSENLFLGDCIISMSTLSNESVDLIVTDPPYGVGIDGSTSNSGHRTPAEYEDDPVSVLAMLRTAFKEMRRVLKANGHAYIFATSVPSDQVRIINLLSESGFDVEPIPLIWIKDSHTTVDWDYRYAPSYESILFCSNRQKRLAAKRSDIFTFNNDPDRVHTAQKPVLLLRTFIEMSSAEGEVVFDPFMGSGSTIIASIRSLRRYIGMEHNKSIFGAAQVRIMNELESRRPKEECTNQDESEYI